MRTLLFFNLMLSLSFLYSQDIGFLGDFNGWGDDVDMATTDNNTHTKNGYYLPAGDIKFREGNDWAARQWPSSGNHNVTSAGFYDISLDLTNNSFSLTAASSTNQNISLIGDFNSWGDTAMTTTDNITYTLDAVSITAGNVKFRRDSAWECNWGDTATADGTADPNSGDNISIAADNTYDVSFNLATLAYAFTVSNTASINNIALNDLIDIHYNSSLRTLNVTIESIQQKFSYRIFNISGSFIGDGHLVKGMNKLSIDAMSSGLYILDVIDDSSRERSIKKFVIN